MMMSNWHTRTGSKLSKGHMQKASLMLTNYEIDKIKSIVVSTVSHQIGKWLLLIMFFSPVPNTQGDGRHRQCELSLQLIEKKRDRSNCHVTTKQSANSFSCEDWGPYKLKVLNFRRVGGGDSSVVRAPDSWLKGRGFESLLERRENFVLQGRLSVLTLISVSVPPPCYHSST